MLQINKNKLRQKMLMLSFLAIGLFFAGANHALAQSSTIAGEWDAAMNTPGGVRNFKIVFKVEGEKLTGTVKRTAGDVPLEGTIKGSDVQFTYTVNYNGNDLPIAMTGKLDGDTIKGTVNFGGSAEDEWSAKRAATKP
jgi:hypothetical protein